MTATKRNNYLLKSTPKISEKKDVEIFYAKKFFRIENRKLYLQTISNYTRISDLRKSIYTIFWHNYWELQLLPLKQS